MGSLIEINDTLKLTHEEGFPSDLTLERNVNDRERVIAEFLNGYFEFTKTDDRRIFHYPPTRNFLVQEMPDGKWLYWGHALIHSRSIGNGIISGNYEITKLYDPEYQKLVTINESPEGKAYLFPLE